MLGYVWRDVVRNPRRTIASLVGITLGVGLCSAVLFFDDGSGATLTRRAVAPLAIDVQAVLNAPLGRTLRLDERVSPSGPLRVGDEATVTLTITNEGTVAANEVAVSGEPPPPLRHVPGSTGLDPPGSSLPDVEGQSPLAQGLARTGLNLGTLAPRTQVALRYRARAGAEVAETGRLELEGRISSREDVVPVRSNAPSTLTAARLQEEIGRIPGVAAADALSYVDLPATSVSSGTATVADPVRVFAFDRSYQEHYPSIRVAAGSFEPGRAMVSAEAARTLGAEPGGTISVALPGGGGPLTLPVSGVVDLAQARPLFASRKTSKLEDFLYVANVVVVDPATFERSVVPAFRDEAAARGNVVKSLPVSEVDVLVTRTRLRANPASALAQTTSVARAIEAIAPGQVSLIDNISNTLTVARADAAVGRRMFVFLGLPGILLAVLLTAYAGSILAAAQRREQAILRLRGADRRRLLRMLAQKALGLALVGSAAGAGLGLASAMAVLGRSEVGAAPRRDLIGSALLSVGAGTLATGLALCLPAAWSLRHAVQQERREIAASTVPRWWRWRLDLVLVGAALLAEVVAFLTGAFDPPATNVSEGQPAVLPGRLLLAPLLAWTGGTVLSVRLVTALTRRLPVAAAPRFGPLLRGTLFRSLRRRSSAVATGSVGLGLVIAFAMAVTVFAATYDATKGLDSRFTVGADLRVTSSVLSAAPRSTSADAALQVDGVASVAPVVSRLENAVLIAKFNQDRKDLAAIDAASFERTAALSDSFFVDQTAEEAFEELRSDPGGLLVDAETADDLSVEEGDEVQVLLARGTDQQVLETFRVVGMFERFPGFPSGINLVANLATYQGATGLTAADFFLLRAADGSRDGLARVEAGLRNGPARLDPIDVETTATALNRDQSSLTALDLNGLVGLDSVFAALLSAAAIGIFVFALLLQRRREYVTMRALGLHARELLVLVLGEAALVVVAGLVAGLVVGVTMARLLVHVLRPLFILDPVQTHPPGRMALVALLPIAAAGISALLATLALRRLHPPEILRDL